MNVPVVNNNSTTNAAGAMQPADLAKLIEAVKASGARLFRWESGDPTNDAQRNLSGRTHYVDADTLRWHKSRVLSADILADGLLFRITESCALDMNNTRRGKRCVVFDVFGTAVCRPDLESTFTSSDAARNASAREVAAVDLAAHYREALTSKLHWVEQDAEKLKTALAMIAAQPAAVAA